VQKVIPEAGGDGAGAGIDAEGSEEVAQAFHVAVQEVHRFRFCAWVDGLGEVDDGYLSLPVEDVVGGEVAMDNIACQKQLSSLSIQTRSGSMGRASRQSSTKGSAQGPPVTMRTGQPKAASVQHMPGGP
jgi:hypothetical protein